MSPWRRDTRFESCPRRWFVPWGRRSRNQDRPARCSSAQPGLDAAGSAHGAPAESGITGPEESAWNEEYPGEIPDSADQLRARIFAGPADAASRGRPSDIRQTGARAGTSDGIRRGGAREHRASQQADCDLRQADREDREGERGLPETHDRPQGRADHRAICDVFSRRRDASLARMRSNPIWASVLRELELASGAQDLDYQGGQVYARYALVQASKSARRCRPNDPMVKWSQTIEDRKNSQIATVALARKMAGILFAIWRGSRGNHSPTICRG